jgi:hypothetical protein
VNSITTEGLGAGVNVSAIWLYLMVAWIGVLRRDGRAPAEQEPTPADIAAGLEHDAGAASPPH